MTEAFQGRFLRGLPPDKWYTPTIKQHSLEKISLHNQYADVFNKAMKHAWPQRAYIGLYSGAGRAKLHPNGEIIETTAMSVFRLSEPFTHHIFVDKDPRCIEALRGRIGALADPPSVTFVEKNVEDAVSEIKEALPSFSKEKRLLSLCFIDPFSAELDFNVIRELGTAFRVDFLILLMSGVDIRQNFQRYFEDVSDARIAKLIDDPAWRTDWGKRGSRGKELVPFILEKFDAAMRRLDYQASAPGEEKPIRVHGKGVLLYHLLFYSKHPLAKKLFQAARAATDDQPSLGI